MDKIIKSLFVLAVMLGTQASGIVVRTLAFTSPERTLNMKVSLTDSPEFVELAVERENFGNETNLRPGVYTASIEALGKTARFTIPEKGSSRYFLMVFVDLASPMIVVPVADDIKSIPYGSYYIVNALDKDVALIFNEQKILLKSGGSNVFRMPKMPEERNIFPVRMAAIFDSEVGYTQFLKSYWSYQPDYRYISIICKLPSFNLPVVRSISEIRGDADILESGGE